MSAITLKGLGIKVNKKYLLKILINKINNLKSDTMSILS